MKFTDGFWQLRPGVAALYAQEAYDIWQVADTADGPGLRITAPTAVIAKRGDVLNRATLTVTLSSPLEGVVRVNIAHHTGGRRESGFHLPGVVEGGAGEASVSASEGTLTSGPPRWPAMSWAATAVRRVRSPPVPPPAPAAPTAPRPRRHRSLAAGRSPAAGFG